MFRPIGTESAVFGKVNRPKYDFTAENAENAEKKDNQEERNKPPPLSQLTAFLPSSLSFFSAFSAFSAVKSYLARCPGGLEYHRRARPPLSDRAMFRGQHMAGGKLVGIDLGTTFSAIATLDEHGQPVTLAQSRRRNAHPQRRPLSTRKAPSSASRPWTWPWSSPTAWPRSSSGAWAATTSADPSPAATFRPETLSAIILRKLVQDAELRIGPIQQGRHHRAGLLRRHAPQGHQGRRPHRRPGSARHPRRADRRGPGLLLPAARRGGSSAPSAGLPQQEQTVLVYDLGGGTFDVTLVRLSQQSLRDAGHRGRRPPRRQGLGRSHRRSRRRPVPQAARQRPAHRPAVAGQPARRRRAGQAHARASCRRRPSPARTPARC